MRKGKSSFFILCIALLLLLSNISSSVYGVTRWYSAEEENLIFLKDEESIKQEIDKANSEISRVYTQLGVTKSGVKIYTIENINTIDGETHKILMLEEVLRKTKEGTIEDFLYVTYPLVSEIEHYGIKSGYTDSFYTDEYFDKEDNEEYTDIRVDYDFFKEISYEKFGQAVELIDFIDINNLQVIFNPYKLFSSFAYCEDYVPDEVNNRRTRVYFIATEGEDIISTFYHELGHMVYNELVENNEEWYKKYYNIYKDEFNSFNAADNYGRWDEKLTENFAEDFKIYVTNRILSNKREETKFLENLENLVDKKEGSFLSKTTKYPVKESLITEYFDGLLKEYEISGVTTNPLRPDIELQLDDYVTTFKYKNSTYTDSYINKIVTNSKDLELRFFNLGVSELKIKDIKVYEYDLDYSELKNEKVYKSITDNNISIKINKKDMLYVIEVNLEDVNSLYSEVVRYFLFK